MGKEMFIMHGIRRHELALYAYHDTMRTSNKMHVSFRIHLEWRIGGLKRKLKCFTHFFEAPTLFSNFLHMRCMDFIYELVGDQNHDPTTHG